MDDVYRRRIHYARLICGCILTPVICSTGIVVNIINIIVLTRSWMKSSTNVYLTAVAVSDMTYLTHSFLFSLQVYKTFYSNWLYMNCAPIIHGTANLFSNITTWLTVSFTIERFINISFPIFGHRVCTRGKARRIVCCVVLFAFIFTFPDYLQRKVTPPLDANGTIIPGGRYKVEDSDYQPILTKFGYAFINQVTFVILPFLLLTIFNILLIKKGLEAGKVRRGMSKHHFERVPANQTSAKSPAANALKAQNGTASKKSVIGEQQRVTVMLISIVVAFLLMQIPSTVLNIISNVLTTEQIVSDARFYSTFIVFSNISNVLLFTNATMNFVFYSLFSIKFRTTCKSLFGKSVFSRKRKDQVVRANHNHILAKYSLRGMRTKSCAVIQHPSTSDGETMDFTVKREEEQDSPLNRV